MRRVLILGCAGAGKSTLARQLGKALALPVFHLDAIFWKPGWVMTPADEEEIILQRIVAGEKWIIDGNYAGNLNIRLPRADTILFMDFPRRVCLWRVVRRWMMFRGKQRPDMGPDCPEKIDLEFLQWIWNYNRDVKPQVLALVDEYRSGKNIRALRSSREVRDLLASIEAEAKAPKQTEPAH
ncbi:MAG TPA: DNA topology modulation protein [Planctomycetota bacterium]|jgi:adenylate kinase family enzyme